MRYLTHEDIRRGIAKLSFKVMETAIHDLNMGCGDVKIYGVPRGGISVAYGLHEFWEAGDLTVVDDLEEANFIIDDLIDSGKTKDRYEDLYPDKPFYALFEKGVNCDKDEWLIFPWEVSGCKDPYTSIDESIERIAQFTGASNKEVKEVIDGLRTNR